MSPKLSPRNLNELPEDLGGTLLVVLTIEEFSATMTALDEFIEHCEDLRRNMFFQTQDPEIQKKFLRMQLNAFSAERVFKRTEDQFLKEKTL